MQQRQIAQVVGFAPPRYINCTVYFSLAGVLRTEDRDGSGRTSQRGKKANHVQTLQTPHGMMRQEQTRQNKQTNKPKERRNDLWHVTCANGEDNLGRHTSYVVRSTEY